MNSDGRQGKRYWDFFFTAGLFNRSVKGLTITGAKRAGSCTKVCNFYHKKIFLSYFFIAQAGFSALYLLLVPFFPIFHFLSFALAVSPVISSGKPADTSADQMRRRHTRLSAIRPRLSRQGRDRRRDTCRPTEISAFPCSVPPPSFAAPPPVSSR